MGESEATSVPAHAARCNTDKFSDERVSPTPLMDEGGRNTDTPLVNVQESEAIQAFLGDDTCPAVLERVNTLLNESEGSQMAGAIARRKSSVIVQCNANAQV